MASKWLSLAPLLLANGYGELNDRVRKEQPQAFIVKIQQFAAQRGVAPNAFVESGMPAELLEAIETLFNLEHERIAEVIPPRLTGAKIYRRSVLPEVSVFSDRP